MADMKCDALRYCGATVYDFYDIINVIDCECLKCMGKNCATCNTYKISAQLQIDLQRQRCEKCEYFDKSKAAAINQGKIR